MESADFPIPIGKVFSRNFTDYGFYLSKCRGHIKLLDVQVVSVNKGETSA
jgi:hypothetical protein